MRNLFVSFSILVLSCLFNNIVECARHPRIINGNSTKPDELKYVVFIDAIDLPKHRRCTGGIIDDYHVLTAAHCVITKDSNDFKSSRFKIIAGTNDLNSTSPKIERFVNKIMVPKVYNGTDWIITSDSKQVIGDIAVLKLKESFDLSNTDKLDNLELPEVKGKNPHDDSHLKDQILKLAGFGWNHIEEVWNERNNMLFMDGYAGYSDGKLMKADIMLFNREECENESIDGVDKTYICAKMTKQYMSQWRGVCRGDSGSPLVYKNKTVVGVVSSGYRNCNENWGPTKYTRVASFRKFIDNALLGLTDDMRSKTADRSGYF